jgi:calcineurin-like phosphoesterase family protein
MEKLNSNWYTKGKLDRKTRRPTDQENEFLYSRGMYLTKIKEEDLPSDYIKFKSRSIWYMTGYLKTSGVKDLYYTYIKENHLFKDDYLYISYDKKIEEIKDEYGYEEIRYFDFFICGNDIIDILFAIEKNSNIDTTKVRNKIKEKFEWWKENEVDDYKSFFGGKEVNDIFEYYNGTLNAKTYFISDTHFNHKNIIKYCNRPFKDIEEMNNTLIKNWNNTVTDYDTVYHLGDVALTNESEMKNLISKLKGKKILIRGNHDAKSMEFFKNVGFYAVTSETIKLEQYKIILSHIPLDDTKIPEGYTNIHGHIHNNPLYQINPTTNEMEYPKELYSEKLHINVSVDVIDFKPISLEEILKKIKEKQYGI